MSTLQHYGKGIVRVAKNYTKGYSDVQAKVRDATSNDPWGPSGTQMNELAQLTYNQSVLLYLAAVVHTDDQSTRQERLHRDHGDAGQTTQRQGQELAACVQSACSIGSDSLRERTLTLLLRSRSPYSIICCMPARKTW